MKQKLSTFLVSYWHLVILIGVFFISTLSLYQPHLFHVHDYVHGARIAQMSLALKDGHFPVIWTRDFGFGYGMPLFEFYAPLPYYVGSLFYLLGFSLSFSVKTLFILPSLISLVGAYFLGKTLFRSRLSGVILASTFTLASYRGLNLFVRGAVSESWGMAFYPLILLASYLVITRRRRAWLLLVFSLFGLFLSHNLSTMMFLPFAVFWTLGTWLFVRFKDKELKNLAFWHKNNSLGKLYQTEGKVLVTFVGSYLLAFGLGAFYLVPAFLEKNYTQVEEIIIGGYFNFRLHFIYLRQLFQDNWGYGGSTWGPNDDISFFLGFGQWLGILFLTCLVGFSLGYLLAKRFSLKKWPTLNRQLVFTFFELTLALVFFSLAVLMATEKTLFLWQAVSLLKFMQFPWRYLSVAVMFLSLALASLPVFAELFHSRWWRRLIYLLSLVVIVVTLSTSWRYFWPEGFLTDDQALYYQDRSKIATSMSGILPDYIPTKLKFDWAKDHQNKSLDVVVLPDWLDKLNQQDKLDKERLKVLVDKTQATLVSTNLPLDEVTLVFNRAYYPGWQAEIDGQKTKIKITPEGLIAIKVPKGQHRVGVYLTDTPVRRWSKVISVISLVVLLVAVSEELFKLKKQKKHERN